MTSRYTLSWVDPYSGDLRTVELDLPAGATTVSGYGAEPRTEPASAAVARLEREQAELRREMDEIAEGHPWLRRSNEDRS